MKALGTLLMLSGLAALGCTSVENKYVTTQALKNDQGHVIGHTETLRTVDSGEQFERTVFYVPRRNANGEVVGYEEPVASGAVLRNVEGKRVGVRYVDLRSRGSNPNNDGVTVVVVPE